MALWRVEASLMFPTNIPTLPNGDLPPKFLPVSRIQAVAQVIDGVRMMFRRSARNSGTLLYDIASLILFSEAGGARPALLMVTPVIERILESLSYQLQYVLKIHELEVLDVTFPVAVGDERAFLAWPMPHGYHTPIFAPAMVSFGVSTPLCPDPTKQLEQSDQRVARALDWYLKAIRSDLEADQFMFLWIATEILADGSNVTESAPVRLRCQHTVSHCPVCGKPTDRPIQGQGRKKYLRDVFGFTEEEAVRTWEMRQMLHGAVSLESREMETLPAISKRLRRGVIQELNSRFALTGADAPRLDPANVSIAPGVQVEGRRAVTAWHLDT